VCSLIVAIQPISVPADQMAEHVRIELMDPRYYKQRRAEKDRNENPNNKDSDIFSNLKGFADRRTDIFGDTEVDVGQTIQEDTKKEKKRNRDKILWDGHSTSITEVIASKNLAEQLTVMQAKKGSAPSPFPPPPTVFKSTVPIPVIKLPPKMIVPTPIQPLFPPKPIEFSQPPPPPLEDDHLVKKLKTAHDNLLSAEAFIAQSQDKAVRIKVKVPNEIEKSNTKLGGQLLSFDLALTDSVLQLKEKLSNILGIKPKKQKLVTANSIILKDHLTFADHNLSGDVQLQLKERERGGKK